MKIIYLILLILALSISCKPNPRKEDLVGIWESFESHHTKVVLTFYQDSVITEYLDGGIRTKSSWVVADDNIHFNIASPKSDLIVDEISYLYKLNLSKDTLWLKVKNGSTDDYSTLRKVLENSSDSN